VTTTLKTEDGSDPELELYPLQFDPIFEYRPWGGRQLANLLVAPLPDGELIGEAWVLSDRAGHPSLVAAGPLKGQTIHQLLLKFQKPMMGNLAGNFSRFPLLLKFLDAQGMLSVQVHPSDAQIDLLPEGETGKTEAWVVLDASVDSRLCVGLKPGATTEGLRRLIANGTLESELKSFVPKSGDAVFVPAGTIHTLGNGVVVFEVQQNSDVTFRLDDWGRVDTATGKPRALQVENAIASIDFSEHSAGLSDPVLEPDMAVERRRLFDCKHFRVWRLTGLLPFPVGAVDVPRVLVCIEGKGQIKHGDQRYMLNKGGVMLLPASVGVCNFQPHMPVVLLEIAIPEST
jgi:mannose-6-phosphate isomerase